MRILPGIILLLSVSYCTAEDDYEDLILAASSPSCAINSSEDGVCVKKSQCSVDTSTNSPRRPFTVRYLGSTQSNPNQCGWAKVCCPSDSITTDHKEKEPIRLGCGYSNPGGVVMRGFSEKATYAAYADFPWMVALMVKKDIKGKTFKDEYIGGGTLIHPSVVMTVAHKVYQAKPEQLKCRAGEWNWEVENERHKHQERDVASVIINENYDKVHVYYDVALLVLSSPYDLSNAPHIGMACLEPHLPSPGTVCYSMGWGKDIKNNNENAKILKKLELPLVQKNICQNLLRNTRLGTRYKLHRSFTCAGGEAGVDTCQGDGGSPLVCRIPDPDMLRYSVVGMVTYGVDCGIQNVPGVYTNVPEVHDWVINKMTNLHLDISSFTY